MLYHIKVLLKQGIHERSYFLFTLSTAIDQKTHDIWMYMNNLNTRETHEKCTKKINFSCIVHMGYRFSGLRPMK